MFRSLLKRNSFQYTLLHQYPKRLKSDAVEPQVSTCTLSSSSHLKGSIADLNFVNTAVNTFPIEKNPDNKPHHVRGYNYSRVTPTPRDNPQIACLSESALALLDLDKEKITKDPDAPFHLSGNKLPPKAEPIAHCYCGHQFGSFAGQLGDGRAITLGDIRNFKGELWELQLKGAGKTPYSRFSDGKAVLRSSIREYLCSEAMWALGIPTSRAGSLIVTDTSADRDPMYNGRMIREKCAIVLRLAPTFWRFGSFEIFKEHGSGSWGEGPSCGLEKEMMPRMLNYILEYFYPEISRMKETQGWSIEECWMEMFKEIVRRTARLVALWQCYGFCHGVLNTDNMSILGLTIDYGPFGWMDYFDKSHVCNSSDRQGRYSYENQPKVCKWNLYRLSEALSSHLPIEKMQDFIEKEYDEIYNLHYYSKMREKLGLYNVECSEDKVLIDSLFDVMHSNASDFTNTFRKLSLIQIPKDPSHSKITPEIMQEFLKLSPTMDVITSRSQPKFPEDQIKRLKGLAVTNPSVLETWDITLQDIDTAEIQLKKYKEIMQKDPKELLRHVEDVWRKWLRQYEARLYKETFSLKGKRSETEDVKVKKEHNSIKELQDYRVDKMNKTNPVYVLRNYMAQEAIKQAEKGNFGAVDKLLELLMKPFEEGKTQEYIKCPPRWASDICVSCSS